MPIFAIGDKVPRIHPSAFIAPTATIAGDVTIHENASVRSEWSIADDLAAGRLVRLLPEAPPPGADVMALVASRAGRSARVTAFIAALRQAFTRVPWREGAPAPPT